MLRTKTGLGVLFAHVATVRRADLCRRRGRVQPEAAAATVAGASSRSHPGAARRLVVVLAILVGVGMLLTTGCTAAPRGFVGKWRGTTQTKSMYDGSITEKTYVWEFDSNGEFIRSEEGSSFMLRGTYERADETHILMTSLDKDGYKQLVGMGWVLLNPDTIALDSSGTKGSLTPARWRRIP